MSRFRFLILISILLMIIEGNGQEESFNLETDSSQSEIQNFEPSHRGEMVGRGKQMFTDDDDLPLMTEDVSNPKNERIDSEIASTGGEPRRTEEKPETNAEEHSQGEETETPQEVDTNPFFMPDPTEEAPRQRTPPPPPPRKSPTPARSPPPSPKPSSLPLSEPETEIEHPVKPPPKPSPKPTPKPKPTVVNPPRKGPSPSPKSNPSKPKPSPPTAALALPLDVEHQAHHPIPLWPAPKKFTLKNGIIQDPRIKFIPINIGRGGSMSPSSRFNGIVVHMTYEPTLQGTLNVWRRDQKVGTHFIIDRNGGLVQVASLNQYTNHVGPIRPRCNKPGGDKNACLCYSRGGNWNSVGAAESRKPYPRRNLMNSDSIGIEVVRFADKVPGGTGDRTHKYRKAFYAQQYALTWLIKSLKLSFEGSKRWEVQRHPCIAWNKQITEAESCDWDWNLGKMETKYRPQGRGMYSK